MNNLVALITSFLPAAMAAWAGAALVCCAAHAQQTSEEDGIRLAAHYFPHRGPVESSKRSTVLLSNSLPVFSEGTENSSSFKSIPDFANPPAEYRPHHMNHQFTSPHTRDRWTPEMLAAMSAKVELGKPPPDGAFATLDQLLANKAGGTVINVAWTDR